MIKLVCIVENEQTVVIDSIGEKLLKGQEVMTEDENLSNSDIRWYVEHNYLKVEGKIKQSVVEKKIKEELTKKFKCTLKQGRLVLGSISGGVNAGGSIDIKVIDLSNKDIVSSINKGWLVEEKPKRETKAKTSSKTTTTKKANTAKKEDAKKDENLLEPKADGNSIIMDIDKTPHDSNAILDLNMSEVKVKEEGDDFSNIGKEMYKDAEVKKPAPKKTSTRKKTTRKKTTAKKTTSRKTTTKKVDENKE